MSVPMYFNADSDTARIIGLLQMCAASSAAVKVSILYMLNAGMAYLPTIAF